MERGKHQILGALQDITIISLCSALIALIMVKPQTPTENQSKPPENGTQVLGRQNIKTIEIGELQKIIENDPIQNKNKVLIIDARDPAFFELGTIPNSINLPLAEFEIYIKELEENLKEAEKIIIYCSSHSCPDSKKLALKLQGAGYQGLYIYKGGYQEWSELTQK